MNERKQYLGDGIYVDFDGYALVLTTENGYEVTSRIVIEEREWQALRDYVERLTAARSAAASHPTPGAAR